LAHQLFEHLVVSSEVLLDNFLGVIVFFDSFSVLLQFLKGQSFGLKALNMEVDLTDEQLRESLSVLFLL